jgi:hypothetical protein
MALEAIVGCWWIACFFHGAVARDVRNTGAICPQQAGGLTVGDDTARLHENGNGLIKRDCLVVWLALASPLARVRTWCVIIRIVPDYSHGA